MELATLLPYIAVLACPIAMGLMMWMMSRNMGGHSASTPPGEQTPAARLGALRQQRQALEAEISEVTRIVELEAERNRALAAQSAVADKARVGDTVLQR